MIKKKNLLFNKILWQKYIVSLLKIKKLWKKKGKKKSFKLFLKKNILLKKILKKKRLLKKYKNYKLLNLKILKKKKLLYLNFYNRFFDILIWAIYVFSNKVTKYSLRNLRLKKKKKNKIFKNIKFKRFKKRKKKKFLFLLKKDKIKKKFILNILTYLYYLGLLNNKNMFSSISENLDFTNKQKFLKYNKDLSEDESLKSNIVYLRKVLLKWNKIKKNITYKILKEKKNLFFINKRLNYVDKKNLKKNIFNKNSIKKVWKSPRILKKKFIIKKRVKKYFKNFIKKTKFTKKASLNQRLFYYDFFFNSYEKKLFFLKKRTSVSFLWNKVLNKNYLRYRLSEYIFLLLNNIEDNFLIKNKIFYILNFYKIIVFLKKKLKNLKKYLLKKNILLPLLKKNKKNFKYYLKKEYFIQKNIYINLGKSLIKYYSMLKYFNKIFYFLSKSLNFNVKNIVEDYNGFIYLSFLLNLTINEKNYIPLVSLNNYFMQKTNKSFVNAWLLNDRVFNYIDVFNKIYKKDLYWNNLSPIYNLAKRGTEKSYIMVPGLVKNMDSKYTYFFGKKPDYVLKNFYRTNIQLFFFIYIYIYFLKIFNSFNNKKFFFYFFNFNNKKFLNIFSFNNLIFLNNILNINKLNFLNKISILKFNLIINFLFKSKKLIIKRKKNFLLKLFSWLLFFNFKQNYGLLKLKNFTYLVLNFLNISKKYFTGFYKSMYFNSNKFQYLKNKKFLINTDHLNINKYIFKIFFLNIKDNYYTTYSTYNNHNYKKCILHLIEKKTNNFLVLSLFDTRRVIGHTSAGQGLYRAYNNSKRQKKGTGILSKVIFRKLRLRARKYSLKEVFLKSNLYWNFRINFLTKYWVLRYKLGVPFLKGLKLGLGLPYHKGLRVNKRKRK